jgi:hypothetical protein
MGVPPPLDRGGVLCYTNGMKIRVGDRVKWASNQHERGTVIDVDYAAVKVRWDDGVVSTYSLTPAAAGSIAQLAGPTGEALYGKRD